jgi:hypothetical protein
MPEHLRSILISRIVVGERLRTLRSDSVREYLDEARRWQEAFEQRLPPSLRR